MNKYRLGELVRIVEGIPRAHKRDCVVKGMRLVRRCDDTYFVVYDVSSGDKPNVWQCYEGGDTFNEDQLESRVA